MEDIRTVNALSESVTRMEHLLEAEPTVAACDLHPKYHTTAFAESLGLPLVRVQHHYAHILSCMAENDVLEEQVLGVSFDGTGYGTDGTIWGGEILLSDLDGFTRKASITPFLQAGGDAAAREGWRIAAGCLYGITKEKERILQLAQALSLGDRTAILAQMAMADHRLNTVTSTSAGRLSFFRLTTCSQTLSGGDSPERRQAPLPSFFIRPSPCRSQQRSAPSGRRPGSLMPPSPAASSRTDSFLYSPGRPLRGRALPSIPTGWCRQMTAASPWDRQRPPCGRCRRGTFSGLFRNRRSRRDPAGAPQGSGTPQGGAHTSPLRYLP